MKVGAIKSLTHFSFNRWQTLKKITMRHIFSIIILVFLITNLYSQDSIYIDNGWLKCSKEKAKYTKYIFKDSLPENLILIKMYDKNRHLSFVYSVKSLEPEIKEGFYNSYSDDNKMIKKCNYKDDKLNGELLTYFDNGNLRRRDYYEKDSLIKGQCYTSLGKDTSYYPETIHATFKGKSYLYVRNFIAEKVEYPNDALMKNIQGDVILCFSISKDDKIVDIEILQSTNDIFNDESVRVLKKSQKYWKHGFDEGEAAKEKFVIPVKYRL